MFYLLYKDILMTVFLTIFQRFLTAFRRFLKIFQNLSEGHTNVFRKFGEMPEQFRRLPKTFEDDPKMFRSYTNKLKNNLRDKLDISEIIDIVTGEDGKYRMPLESRM